MSGYIQWPAEHKFKPGDLMLNGGLFWTVDGDGNFRILDDNGLLPICGGMRRALAAWRSQCPSTPVRRKGESWRIQLSSQRLTSGGLVEGDVGELPAYRDDAMLDLVLETRMEGAYLAIANWPGLASCLDKTTPGGICEW